LATGADAVASAMMAVPIFVPYNIINVIFVIRSQTKGTKLSFAFILDSSFLK